MSSTLARARRLDLGSFAIRAGLHPEFVQRLVSMGSLEAHPDARGRLWFHPTQLTAAARLLRLRAGLGLNYAALDLVVDLLDRIAHLGSALYEATRKRGAWG